MTLLSCIIIQILWAFSAKGQACEEPPAIDFGEIVSDDKLEYREGDKVQYKCNPGYSLMGTEWITCSGKTWKPAPQCLAPCSLTKQQLENKNLLLSNGQRHAQLIQSDHTLEFMCSEGYTLTTSSVRKCVNGHMDLPLCISERGKNCSRPPTIENGDITTFLEKGYTSGSFLEFKCQKFYAMEGQNRSFCNNGNWTKAPLCLEPCAISVEEMENQMVELNGRANETILQWMYLKRGDFLELRCKPGYALATNLSQSTFMVQCRGNPIVYPECKEMVCDPPEVVNGRFRPQRNVYRDGDVLIITCSRGFHTNNDQDTTECTKNGWLPPPRCSRKKSVLLVIWKMVNLYLTIGPPTKNVMKFHICVFPKICRPKLHAQRMAGHLLQDVPPNKAAGKCGYPPAVDNGDIMVFPQEEYEPGSKVEYKCQNFYRMNGSASVSCESGQWTDPPVCLDMRCAPPPEIHYGRIRGAKQQRYLPGDRVRYQCLQGLSLFGFPMVKCKEGEWSVSPVCKEAAGKCGYPPAIDNGDIMVFPQEEYEPGSKVEYKCQRFYRMNGSASVSCESGQWTDPPVCLELCITSPEDMEKNNIGLKWSLEFRLNLKSGDFVEFDCKNGYVRDPTSSAFRVQCVEGKLAYPKCKRRGTYE
ncbi:unnamed protein product [Eretmochelys imbricata]